MVGCTFIIATILLSLGGFIIYMDLTHSAERQGVVLIVGGGFALTGFFVFIGGIQRALASRTPQTILEVDEVPFARGSTIRAAVIQQGPVELKSLRVNLVCLRTTTRIVRRKGRDEKDYTTQEIFSVNAFDSSELVLGEGERFDRTFEIQVPEDAIRSGQETKMTTIQWKLETWGGGSFRNRFMHPFTVVVT